MGRATCASVDFGGAPPDHAGASSIHPPDLAPPRIGTQLYSLPTAIYPLQTNPPTMTHKDLSRANHAPLLNAPPVLALNQPMEVAAASHISFLQAQNREWHVR